MRPDANVEKSISISGLRTSEKSVDGLAALAELGIKVAVIACIFRLPQQEQACVRN